MIVNKPCKNSEYAELAIYCNENDCHIAERATYYESVPNYHPAPTIDEIKEMRRQAYTAEVDPITAHIQRLRDEEQTEEIVKKIEELLAERALKVEEIKARYPYPYDPDESGDESGDSFYDEEDYVL